MNQYQDHEEDVHELLRVAVRDVRRPVGASAVELIDRARRRRRSRRALGSVLAVAVTAAVAGVITLTQSGPRTPALDPALALASNTVPMAERSIAPELSGHDLAGTSVSLAQFRGKVVVINVWGSWCAPCQGQADAFESVFKATEAQGVQFLGIDSRDQLAAARAYQSAHGLTYPSLSDPDGALLSAFPAGSLNPQVMPSTLIIDRHGRIAVHTLRLLLTGPQLRATLAQVLAERN